MPIQTAFHVISVSFLHFFLKTFSNNYSLYIFLEKKTKKLTKAYLTR